MTVGERFWAKVDKADGGCWTWTAYTNPKGYGMFGVSTGAIAYAHRFAYELVVGPIPDGWTIDHLCRNRGCVRPSHLEAVTNAVNVLRGIGPTAVNARKTHCIRGHEFTPENTGKASLKAPGRQCLACRREKRRGLHRTTTAADGSRLGDRTVGRRKGTE